MYNIDIKIKRNDRGKDMKCIAHMKDKDGKEFPYSLNAKDLTEADERAKNLAEASGWLYYDLEVPLVQRRR